MRVPTGSVRVRVVDTKLKTYVITAYYTGTSTVVSNVNNAGRF